MESRPEIENLKATAPQGPQSILVPVDGSEVARHASDLAFRLAQRCGARLHLLHVVPLPLGATAGIFDDSLDLKAWEQTCQQSEVRYRDWAKPYGPETQVHVRSGELIGAIAEVCSSQAIELIVMGTAGDHGWHERLIGSNAEHVLHEIRVPLLTLKCDRSDLLLRNLLVINDFTELPAGPLPTLRWFSELDGAQVHLLKVGTAEPQLDKRMAAFARQQGLDRVVHHVLPGTDVEEAVVRFVQQHEIDLVALGTRDRSSWYRLLHGSISSRIVNHLFKPVLTFHL